MGDSESESDDFSDDESLLSPHEKPVPKWDMARVVPPEVEVGSAVKNVWWIRGEKIVKVISSRIG